MATADFFRLSFVKEKLCLLMTCHGRLVRMKVDRFYSQEVLKEMMEMFNTALMTQDLDNKGTAKAQEAIDALPRAMKGVSKTFGRLSEYDLHNCSRSK